MGRAAASVNLPRRRRSAVTVLELILWFPVVLILIAGVIEFGVLMAQLKHLALASRVGAKVASELSPATLATHPLAVQTVRQAVERQLSCSNMTSCTVTMEENVTAYPATTTRTDGTCVCPVINTAALPDGTNEGMANPSGTVRVTVCVELISMTPDLLQSFGFSITGRRASHSTTYVYEGL